MTDLDLTGYITTRTSRIQELIPGDGNVFVTDTFVVGLHETHKLPAASGGMLRSSPKQDNNISKAHNMSIFCAVSAFSRPVQTWSLSVSWGRFLGLQVLGLYSQQRFLVHGECIL